MGLLTDAKNSLGGGKKKKGGEYTNPNEIGSIEDSYGTDEEEEEDNASLMDLFSQWTAQKLKNGKSKAKMAEVD